MRLSALLVLAIFLSLPMALHAQEELSEADTVGAASEAERIVRLQQLIESDQERLSQLQEELTERETATATSAQELTVREENLSAMEARLDGMADAAEKAALQDEIDADRGKYEIVKDLTDTALQAEKNVRSQIRALEEKIALDRRALEDLLQIAEPPGPAETGAEAPEEAAAAEQDAARPEAAEDAASETVDEAAPDTPEQIEARRRAERFEQEAEQAEQAVVGFLEQKAALQEQIDLEKSLLQTARETRATLEQGEQIRRQEFSEHLAAGADEEVLGRARQKLADVEANQREIEREIGERANRLESLHQRMQELQEEQLSVVAEAERRREEAEAARSRSKWLESPLNPRNIGRWALERGPDMLAVVVIAAALLILIRLFLQRFTRAVVRGGRREGRDAATRADTLALSLGNAATMLIVIVALFLVFEAAGVRLATILGGAAIIGFAFAFGAQNLMRDYFNGLIILIEDQYELNDIVTINDITGRVERVSLRTTALRDLEGKLHFIPNGEIKSVTNRSYEWAQVVLSIRVAYKENADRVMEEILSVARGLHADKDFEDAIIEEPTMLGVDEFGPFGFTVKCLLKTAPGDLYRVKREVLRRIKNRFDELGIEIPVPGAAALQRE